MSSQNLYSRVLAVMYPDNIGIGNCDGPDPPYTPARYQYPWVVQHLIGETCPVCCSEWDGFDYDGNGKDLEHTFRFKCKHAICTDCHKGMKDSGRTMRCPLCRADEDESIVFERCKSCNRFGHKTRGSKQCPLNAERLMQFILRQQTEVERWKERNHDLKDAYEDTQMLLGDERANIRKKRTIIHQLKQKNKILKLKLNTIAELSERDKEWHSCDEEEVGQTQ